MSLNREQVVPGVICALILVVYLAFPTQNYYWDGITFAQIIENASTFGVTLFHPNHLIYNIVGYLIYDFVSSLGFQVRAITTLQVTNAFVSAAAAYVLFMILKDCFKSIFIATVLTLLFSFSATWWRFSTDANGYIPSILFLLIAFYLILPGRKPRPILVALLHTAAMCFHQLAVFFFPVVVLGLYLQSSSEPSRQRFWRVSQYTGVAFILTFGSYYTAFYMLGSTFDFGQFFSWLTSYSPENGFVFNFLRSFERTLSGEIKLFFGGRFNFVYEVFNPITAFVLFLIILALCGLFYGIVRIWKDMPVEKKTRILREYRPLFLLSLTWAISYLVFLFFWIPQNTFYRLFYLPSLILLLGLLLKKYEHSDWHKRVAVLLVAIVAFANFVFFIYPYSRVRKETPLALATQMNELWSPKTIVYFSKMESDNNLIKYFNPATTWLKAGEIQTEEFEQHLEQIYSSGGNVWLETSAYKELLQREGGAGWLKDRISENEIYKVHDPAYDVTLIKIIPRSK